VARAACAVNAARSVFVRRPEHPRGAPAGSIVARLQALGVAIEASATTGRERPAVRLYLRESTLAAVQRERGVVLIIAYKFVKAGLWLVLAVVILAMTQIGLGDRLLGLAAHLRLHAHPWSLHLADLVVKASSRRSLHTITVALLADGTLTLVEGWALLHGHWWGPWLVVVATSALLPLEILALVHHPHVVRALVLLVNLAIVAYLARTALRERRLKLLERHDAGSAPPPRGELPPA
jgi:uncharacterized membrane protein (DUF2068 family)